MDSVISVWETLEWLGDPLLGRVRGLKDHSVELNSTSSNIFAQGAGWVVGRWATVRVTHETVSCVLAAPHNY